MLSFRIKLVFLLLLVHFSICSSASECLLPNNHNARSKITLGDTSYLSPKNYFTSRFFESASPEHKENSEPSNLNTWVDTGVYFSKGHKLTHDSLQMRIKGTIVLNHDVNYSLYNYTKENINYLTSWLWASTNATPNKMCIMDNCVNEPTLHNCLKKDSMINLISSPPKCLLQDGDALVGFISEHEPTASAIASLTDVFFIKMNEVTADGAPYFSLLPKTCTDGSCKNKLIHGKLYLKLLSGNAITHGGYTVHISHFNHETTKGFSGKIISIEKLSHKYARLLQAKVMGQWEAGPLFRAIIILYLAVTSLAFILGIIPLEREELVQYLVKICLLCAVMNPHTINYAETLADYVIDASKEISNVISYASLQSNLASINKTIVGHPTMMDIYDKIIESFLSFNTHIRIWSLLTSYPLYIPLIYTVIFVTLMAIMYGFLVYLISISLINLFIVFAPLMLCFRAFKITTPIFDAWLKFLIRCGLLNILSAAANGLFIGYMGRYTAPLLEHTVCLQTPDFLSNIGANIFQVWKPMNIDILNEHLSLANWHEQLLIALVFYKVISIIPAVVDSILPSIYTPFAQLVEQIEYTISTNWFVTYGKALNPLSIAFGRPHDALARNTQYVRRAAIHGLDIMARFE